MPLTPQDLFSKVKMIESQLCVKREGRATLLIFHSLDGRSNHSVRMPNEVWLHFLKRQIEGLPADTPTYACSSPFPSDPDYAGDAEHFPVLPPPDASQEETPNPSPLPGDEGTGEQHA